MPEIKQHNALVRAAEFRAINEEDRTAEFIISTESVDRHGTVFRIDGWDLSEYESNPIVTYGHRANDPNPDFIIGTSTVFREGDKLIGRVTFEPAAENPLAEKVFRKVKSGTIRMASVGAMPKEGDWGNEKNGEQRGVFYFSRQTLLEWAVCGLGSNPETLKRSAEALDAIRAEIPKETEQTPPAADDIEVQRSFRERQLLINEFSN